MLCCALFFSRCVRRPCKHWRMKSFALQSPSNCRQGQPLPSFPDGKQRRLHLRCFFASPSFFLRWGWETAGNKREAGQQGLSVISDLRLAPLQCQGKHTHKYTHAQTKEGQPASVCSVWCSFIGLMAKHYFSGHSFPFKRLAINLCCTQMQSLILRTLYAKEVFLTSVLQPKKGTGLQKNSWMQIIKF